jgi:hypothetical protein
MSRSINRTAAVVRKWNEVEAKRLIYKTHNKILYDAGKGSDKYEKLIIQLPQLPLLDINECSIRLDIKTDEFMQFVIKLDKHHRAALGKFEAYRSPIEVYEMEEADNSIQYSFELTLTQEVEIIDSDGNILSIEDVMNMKPSGVSLITELYSLNHKLVFYTPLWIVSRIKVHTDADTFDIGPDSFVD